MRSPRLQHLIESQQLEKDVLSDLFALADEFRTTPRKAARTTLEGTVVGTLFYEPSTRTRLSFESAAQRLGASVVSTENAKEFSSAVKGETLEDTARIVSKYVDCIIIRHSETGAAKRLAAMSSVPVINAGDGKGQHPTQALLDIYTIKCEFKRIDGLHIAMVGDLASGRTVRSLCYLLGKFEDCRVTFVSPPHLRMGDDIKEYLQRHNVQYTENADLTCVLPNVDVVYMTRIQKERMSPEEYERAKGIYVLDEEKLKLVRPDARLLHPLPKIEEVNIPISIEQTDPRIAYFRQAENGLWARMALLTYMLADERVVQMLLPKNS